MCLREGPLPRAGLQSMDSRRLDGVSDELIVPMAVICAIRLQLWELDIREFRCPI